MDFYWRLDVQVLNALKWLEQIYLLMTLYIVDMFPAPKQR